MRGCALNASLASIAARSTMRANPAVLKGAPRSEVNTKGDFDTIFNQRKQHRIERSDD
jgi:hypothetical protein